MKAKFKKKSPKKPVATFAGTDPVKLTKVTKEGDDTVKIFHHQTIKQSLNYQSAEVSYGVELHCASDDDSIREAIAKAEVIVESSMLPKFKEQAQVLEGLARGR